MSLSRIRQSQRDFALLAVRLFLGFVLLWHGLPKLIDPATASEKFVGMGFPGVLAPVIGALEVGAAVLIIIGYLMPVAVVVAFPIIAVALLAVQIPAGGVHAALERDVLLLITMVVLFSFGPGRYSIGDRLPQPTFISREIQG